MAVPNIFANVTTSIPLAQLDANFATPITLGNTAVYLGNTTTTINNLTLGNVTITSGTINAASNVSFGNANAVVLTNSSNVATTNTSILSYANNGSGVTLGVGYTPTFPWYTYQSGVDIGNNGTGTISARGGYFDLGFNYYLNSSANPIYKTSDYASQITMTGGVWQFRSAASGTAGSAITFNTAFQINSDGTTNFANVLTNSANDIVVGGTSRTMNMFRAYEAGTTGNSGGISFGGNGVKGAIYGYFGGNGINIVAGSNQGLSFGNVASGDAGLQANFNYFGVWNNNGLGIKNTNPSYALDVTGTIRASTGLILTNGSAISSQTLNDYEYGGWTPVMSDSNGHNVTSYYYQFGTYVKIGRLVFVNCTISVLTLGSLNGQVKISNFPFTSYFQSSTNEAYQTAAASFPSPTGSSYPGMTFVDLESNSFTYATVWYVGANGWVAQNANVYSAGQQLHFQMCYFATF